MAGLTTIQQAYNTIKNDIDNTNLQYVELRNDKINLVQVGIFCNTDVPETAIVLDANSDMYTLFSIPDYSSTCLDNASKKINDFVFKEDSKFKDGSLKSLPGVFVNTLKNPIYSSGDTNIFYNNSKVTTTISTNFNNTQLLPSSGIEMFFYFCPNVSGKWTFTVPKYIANQLYSKLWVSNDNALYDYTNDNADICNDQNLDGNSGTKPIQNTFSIYLDAGSIVPVRVHIIASSAYSGASSVAIVTATNPITSEVIAGNNNNNNYFVVFSDDGVTPYYKLLMYFALVLDTKTQKYLCWFLNSGSTQYKKLQNLKLNSKVQYVTSVIPTPLTSVVKGTVVSPNNQPTTINAPLGVALSVKSSYGQSPYDQTVETKKTIQVPTDFPEQTTSPALPDGSKYAGTTANVKTQATTKNVSKTTTTYSHNIIPQSKDVTSQTQSQVNGGNILLITPDQYNSQFGNPATYGNAANNTLTVSYSYVPDQNSYMNKQLYLDANGQLMIQYDYGGTTNSEPIQMNSNPPKWTNGPCPYVLCLDNQSEQNSIWLSVKNGGSVVGYLQLLKAGANNQLPNSLPNKNWLQNPKNFTALPVGKKLSLNGNALISPDGKMKLAVTSTQITIIYGIQPYSTTTGNISLNYTTPQNLDNHNQLYYFYRIQTRGLAGKKFMMENNTTKNIKNLHYVPNNSDKILSFASEWREGNGFYIDPSLTQGNYVTSSGASVEDCKTQCAQNTSCEHGFFMATSSNTGTCYIDNKNTSNPMFLTSNPDTSKYTNGSFFLKKYEINNTCVNQDQNEYYDDTLDNHFFQKDVNGYNINYAPVKNDSKTTYYCGMPWYTDQTKIIDNIYQPKNKGISGFTNMKLSPSTVESFDPNCSNLACFNQNIQELGPIVNYYSKSQDKISQTYNRTQSDLYRHTDLSNNLADPMYKFNGGDSSIPPLYSNNPDPKPSSTILDGRLVDMKHNLLVQNTMFTLASISAASVLLILLFVIKK